MIINSVGGFVVGEIVDCGENSVKIVGLYENGDAEVMEPDGQIAICRIEALKKQKRDLSSLLIETGARPSKALSALLDDSE